MYLLSYPRDSCLRLIPLIILIISQISTCECRNAAELQQQQQHAPHIRKQANIILILTDDQDMELGSTDFMPKTKSLITNQGATFRHAYATTPICCPSRSSILTGLYPHNHNVLTNSGNCSSHQWRLLHEGRTFATAIHAAGYRTGFIGKYLNSYTGDHVPQGWDHWCGLVRNSRYYNYTVNLNGVKVRHGQDYETDYFPDVILNQSLTFMRQHRDKRQPFLLFLSFPSPHGPEDAAPQYQGLFENVTTHRTPSYDYAPNPDKQWILRRTGKMTAQHRSFTDLLHRRRLQTLQSVDDAVQKIHEELVDLDLLDDTFIMYTSDHGYHLGHFGLVKGKSMPFDFDVRIPFMIRGPGIPRGVTIHDIALNIDIAPTLVELSQGSAVNQHEMDGRSLVPLLHHANHHHHVHANDTSIPRQPSWRQSFLLERGKIPGVKMSKSLPVTGAHVEDEEGDDDDEEGVIVRKERQQAPVQKWMHGLRKEIGTNPPPAAGVTARQIRHRMWKEMSSHNMTKNQWLSRECQKEEYASPCQRPGQRFECVTPDRRGSAGRRNEPLPLLNDADHKRIRMRKCRSQRRRRRRIWPHPEGRIRDRMNHDDDSEADPTLVIHPHPLESAAPFPPHEQQQQQLWWMIASGGRGSFVRIGKRSLIPRMSPHDAEREEEGSREITGDATYFGDSAGSPHEAEHFIMPAKAAAADITDDDEEEDVRSVLSTSTTSISNKDGGEGIMRQEQHRHQLHQQQQQQQHRHHHHPEASILILGTNQKECCDHEAGSRSGCCYDRHLNDSACSPVSSSSSSCSSCLRCNSSSSSSISPQGALLGNEGNGRMRKATDTKTKMLDEGTAAPPGRGGSGVGDGGGDTAAVTNSPNKGTFNNMTMMEERRSGEQTVTERTASLSISGISRNKKNNTTIVVSHRRRIKFQNTSCNDVLDQMICFTHDNHHWKTPPFWTEGSFCFCQNANNNTFWCLRLINETDNLLFCQFITGFLLFQDLTRDPNQLHNLIHELDPGTMQQLMSDLNHLKSCSGQQDCDRAGGSHYQEERQQQEPHLSSSSSSNP